MWAERLLHRHEDWTQPLCPITLVISRRMKSSFLLRVINPAWQNETWRPIHAFIYSVGIDWTNIFLPEVIHNLALLCFSSADVIHHPYCGLLLCMSAANQHSFIVLSLCHRESQRLIFSAGCVVKPLAAAVLRVSFHFHWLWTEEEPRAWGRVMCICKPTAASEGFCYLRVRSCRGWDAFYSPQHTVQ